MRLEKPMKVCKLCFNNIKPSLPNFINPNLSLCLYCYQKLEPVFIKFNIDGYNAESIYYYDENIKSLLYQLKGCYDIEIAPIFLERFATIYRLKYHNYILVPAPSYIDDDKKREFNHVVEIFKVLKLKIEPIIIKTKQYKQSDHTKEGRKEIEKHLVIINGEIVRNKNVLIVDDVHTTGSTIKSIIRLLKPFHPKRIKVLVMSKTNDENYI